ncbi:MAG: hypothetical protein FWG36_00975 [Oscillospiraceae bacterium]|nr:hypothetical protein [Oscillospiraceae bacterium]
MQKGTAAIALYIIDAAMFAGRTGNCGGVSPTIGRTGINAVCQCRSNASVFTWKARDTHGGVMTFSSRK